MRERDEVRLVLRQHLNPQVAHLVRRALSPSRALRRMLGVADVRGRVVVHPSHGERRAFRQRERLRESIDVLPAEVPVADVNQLFDRPVRQTRLAADVARAVVRVRLHRLHLDVDRQHIRIGHDIVALAGRNVDVLMAEPQHRRNPRGRLVAEVQPDRRLHRLGLPARLHVDLDDEIGVGIEAPRVIVRQQRRDLAGRPAEEVSFGVIGGTKNQAAVTRGRIGVVHLSRRGRPIDADVRVVHDFRIAGTKFESAHESSCVHRQRDHEDAEHVGAAGRQRVRFRQRDDEIGCAELPACAPPLPARKRRQIACVPFRRAVAGPLLKERDLGVGQRMLTDERPIGWISLPRRHVTPARDERDLRRAALDVGVREKAERRGAVLVVAHRAAIGDERRDVFRIGDGRERRRDVFHVRDLYREVFSRASGIGGSARLDGSPHNERRDQRERCSFHRAKSAMKQPTACVTGCAMGTPATTAVSASARSCTVGAGRSSPRSTKRSSIRPW